MSITGYTLNIENPSGTAEERVSPPDRITENQIEILNDKIIIHIGNAHLSRYTNTNSMDPLIDENSNGIEIIPKTPEDIHVGDIVTYERDGIMVIHRVIEIGEDRKGRYYIVKGDNNKEKGEKIRFKQIKYITIGILY